MKTKSPFAPTAEEIAQWQAARETYNKRPPSRAPTTAPDLDAAETKAAFAIVQKVLGDYQFTLETDEHSGLTVVQGPHLDMKRGRGRTLLGAVRDFLRANTG